MEKDSAQNILTYPFHFIKSKSDAFYQFKLPFRWKFHFTDKKLCVHDVVGTISVESFWKTKLGLGFRETSPFPVLRTAKVVIPSIVIRFGFSGCDCHHKGDSHEDEGAHLYVY